MKMILTILYTSILLLYTNLNENISVIAVNIYPLNVFFTKKEFISLKVNVLADNRYKSL